MPNWSGRQDSNLRYVSPQLALTTGYARNLLDFGTSWGLSGAKESVEFLWSSALIEGLLGVWFRAAPGQEELLPAEMLSALWWASIPPWGNSST